MACLLSGSLAILFDYLYYNRYFDKVQQRFDYKAVSGMDFLLFFRRCRLLFRLHRSVQKSIDRGAYFRRKSKDFGEKGAKKAERIHSCKKRKKKEDFMNLF
ncbi:MAG TPA: hypothetical protein DCG49_05280 [Ruminococcus sp.]|nr:hypothetical protein [Ruminococcus sp.]